ncbi:MAG: hypothetical protein HN548_00280 [Opitutae bacterium]|nr:hypothetical protein [Opitutae bacterium]
MGWKYNWTVLLCTTLAIFAVTLGAGEQKLPNELRWVRQSKEYSHLCTHIFKKGIESIREKVGLLKAAKSKEKNNRFAVVVDLDETILDNSLYQVERWKAGLGFTQDSWSLWVKRKEAGLVPGAKGFLDAVRKMGIRVVFLSNRMNENLEPTRGNLRTLGVLHSQDLFLLRQNKLDTKEKRRKEVLDGTGRMNQVGDLDVIGYVGDQMGDFPGNLSDGIGREFFLLPNPMYGKW